MKTRYLAIVTSALLGIGLSPLVFAQSELTAAQAGIEVITVVGKRPAASKVESGIRPIPEGVEVLTVVGKQSVMPEGIEVITVVGKQPVPSVASLCVNEVLTYRARTGSDDVNALVSRDTVRQAIRDCIEQVQAGSTQS